MVKVVFIKNPFSPAQGRVIKISEVAGRPLSFYISEYVNLLPDGSARVQLNGRTIIRPIATDMEQIVPSQAFIVVMPMVEKGGKNPLGLIAAIALSVVAMGVGGLVATGTWGSFAGASALAAMGGYVAAAAVMFIGGPLVAKLTAPNTSLGKYSGEEDPTYSWNGVQTMEGVSNGIAVTYGTVKSGGQSLVKFTDNDGNDQYFNWLVSAGEGPLEISDIKINNNPVENYENVVINIRSGTNDQDCIDNFNDTIQSKALNYELNNNEWRTDVTDGNSAEGIIVDIECAQGLYHTEDNGNLSTAWVDVKIECALVDTDNWIKITTGYPDVKNNPVSAVMNTSSGTLGNYTVTVGYENNRQVAYVDDDGYEYTEENPHYQQYSITVKSHTKTGKLFKAYPSWTGYFAPNSAGMINVGQFSFDKQIMQSKGAGYSTTLEVYQNGRISGAKLGAVRKQFRIDHLPMGQYKVRATVTARSASVSSTRDGVKTYWTMLSTIVYDDFVYPNIALIGIRAKATSQLSGGTPQLSFLKTRKNVWVFNTHTQAYEEQPANNPAWACYDFLHGAQQLKNIHTGADVIEARGVPSELILYDQFKAWAENCDKLGLKINIEITQQSGFWNAINKELASVGRGMVLQFGTRFGCVYDHKTQPVQLFNMGNIISGSFSLAYLSTDDRANAVEISFNNAAKDYEKDTITIYGDNYDSLDIVNNPTQIEMHGITSYEQAFREGKYQLMCNNLLQQTCSFKADVEAIGCMVGDLILVSHDVPQWAFSGRISRIDGLSVAVVPLDIDDINADFSYALMIRTKSGGLYTYQVNGIQGVYGEVHITIQGNFSSDDTPQAGDLFSLGKVDATAKPFIVKSITRSSDLERTISALEYAEGVFEENYDIPQPDYSLAEEPEIENVINLEAYQIAYKNAAGTQLSKMFVSWQLPDGAQADYFNVLLSDNGGYSWRMATTTMDTEVELDTQPFTEYYVKVISYYRLKQSSGAITGPISAGIDVLPPNVDLLDHEQVATGTRRFWWNFTYPNPNDIAGFVFRYNQGNIITWDTAIPLHTGVVTQQPFEIEALRQGIHTVMVKAVDYAGQYSADVAYAILNLEDPLEDNVLYKVDVGADDWRQTVHNGVINENGQMVAKSNVAFWSSLDAPFWVKPEDAFWQERYSEFVFDYQTQVPASGQFWLRYEITGPARIEYRIVGKGYFWTSSDAPFWNGDADWAFWADDTTMFKPYTGKVLVNAGDMIHIRVIAPENVTEATVVKSVLFIVDVPDKEEHFENITVPVAGLVLPVRTPNYYSTAVRIDAVQGNATAVARAVVITRNPCKIQLLDINNNPVAATVDVTWQGFVKEVV